MNDLNKYAALLFLFVCLPPVLGLILKGRPLAQRGMFALVCFMTVGGLFRPEEWGFTIGFVEYRGHAKGFHFYFVEAFALSLVLAKAFDDWRSFRLLPPGLWLYLLYCALSLLSIVNAPKPEFVYMAALKSVKVSVLFLVGYNFIRTSADLRFFLVTMSATMLWQMVVVLRLKYGLGVYQVAGTFEHQNALSMYATLIGMVLLGAALGPKTRWSNLYLLAYLACGVIQQATLSRAGLAIFAAGSAGVALWSLFDKFTARRFWVLSGLSAVGAVGILMSLDTIIGRFQDYGNEASGATREMLNTASRHMAQDYPLGIGWNNFAMVINKPFPYGQIIDDWEREGGATVDETHEKGVVESHYYLLLAETGYQSLIVYFLLIGLFLWWNFRGALFYRYHFLGSVSLGIMAGTTANYLHSTLERVLTQPRNLMLWMLLLAVTARIHSWRRADRKLLREEEQIAEAEGFLLESGPTPVPAPAPRSAEALEAHSSFR